MATRKLSAYGTFTAVILGADVAPTLKNLADDGMKLGEEVDNSTNRHLYADFVLLTRFVGNPDVGGHVALYLIPAVDGTNYADGGESVAPPASAWVGNFPVRAVDTAQRVALRGVLLPPGKFKPLVINVAGQAMTNTDAENTLSIRTYSEEVV